MPYRPLKEYVARAGGFRLATHGSLRDQLVEMAVEEFPLDADDDRKAEVLAARLKRRAREQYGSVIAMILIGILVNLITKAIIEWWKKNHTHRVLMRGWNAEARADLPPAGDAEETSREPA